MKIEFVACISREDKAKRLNPLYMSYSKHNPYQVIFRLRVSINVICTSRVSCFGGDQSNRCCMSCPRNIRNIGLAIPRSSLE